MTVKKNTWYLLPSLLIIIYTGTRLFTCGITYDEAWTLESFVPASYDDITNFTFCDANNHLLNSLLIKTLFIFCPHELWLARLPNFFALLFYLYFTFLICTNFFSKKSGPFVFLILILNPFILDFFSLARGYGLALGFTAGSIYHLLLYQRDRKLKNIFLLILFACLASTSNFSFVNLLLSSGAVAGCMVIFSPDKRQYPHLIPLFLLPLLTALLIYGPIRKLRENGNLYYGGVNGIYHDTLVSLSKYSLYRQCTDGTSILVLNIFLALLFVSVLYYVFAGPKGWPHLLIPVLTGTCFLSEWLQVKLLNNLYLLDRTVLYLYPLLILSLLLPFNALNQKKNEWLSMLVSAFALINFFTTMNFTRTITWYFDAHSEEIVRRIAEDSKGANVQIELSWPLRKSIDYYSNKISPGKISIVVPWELEKRDRARYFIYLDKAVDQVAYDSGYERCRQWNKDTLLKFENEGIYLFRSRPH